MLTGHTEQVNTFNCWYSSNYPKLKRYCKKYHINEDIINDVYISIHDRIVRSGYTTTQYMTYVKRAIGNLRINNGKKMNGKHFFEIENEDYLNTVENRLIENDEYDKDTQEYREDVLYFSKKIFEYITYYKKYDDESLFVFRTYYLMPNRFTYCKLTQMTGINKNRCTKIIQVMKKDIRTGFLNWLKTNGETGDN